MKKIDINDITLYNRETKNTEYEEIFGKKLMDFFYNFSAGDILTRMILIKRFVSWLVGHYQDSVLSKSSVKKFALKYNFNLSEMENTLDSYQNFNQFFTRKLKNGARKIAYDKNVLISPADSKLTVYNINNGLVVPIKGLTYSISELLQNEDLANDYNNGLCMVFRLAPMDYHRFCYIDSGKHTEIIDIPGLYYSVHPFALSKNYPVFPKNHRQYCVLETENFGNVIYMEVGAMFVGTIFQHNQKGSKFNKADEKGYFKFGGSTVVLLFKQGQINIDNDIWEYSKKGIETIVKYGSAIGSKAF